MTDERILCCATSHDSDRLHVVYSRRVRDTIGAATNHVSQPESLCGMRMASVSPFMDAAKILKLTAKQMRKVERCESCFEQLCVIVMG